MQCDTSDFTHSARTHACSVWNKYTTAYCTSTEYFNILYKWQQYIMGWRWKQKGIPLPHYQLVFSCGLRSLCMMTGNNLPHSNGKIKTTDLHCGLQRPPICDCDDESCNIKSPTPFPPLSFQRLNDTRHNFIYLVLVLPFLWLIIRHLVTVLIIFKGHQEMGHQNVFAGKFHVIYKPNRQL